MPEAKQAPADDQALMKDIRERFSKRRWIIERNWWGNLLFLMGIHWIVYDTSARRWRQRKLSPSVPTPVTNLFRSTLDTVKSAIAQHEPRFLGTPTRDDPRAIAAAAAADANLDILLSEGGFVTARRRSLDWLMVSGNAFIEAVFDEGEETGVEDVSYEQCQACLTSYPPNEIDPVAPTCKACGGQYFAPDESKVIQVPRGRLRFDVLSPFEMFLDPAISQFEDQPMILTIQSYTTEQVSERWDLDVKPDQQGVTTSSQLREQAGAIATPGVGLPFSAQSAADRMNRVTVMRAFIKRHKDYPKGAYLAMTVSGKLLEKKTPYPWVRKSGLKFFPMVHFRFGTMDGRAWGYTPADDLLPKQYQLNKAEGLFTMIMTRMANPLWLIPSGSNPTRITGEIGIQIEYTPVGQAIPMKVPGSEAPASLVKYIQDIRQSFEELSGAFSSVKGKEFGSRTPVGTVQWLTERGFGRWATVFFGLEEGYEDLARKSLEIWRMNIHTPRVKAVRDALGGWTFQEFLGADWDDGVNIQVEAGSARPKTQQQKLQNYLTLAQVGALNMGDQAQVIKMLEDIGMSNLLPGVEEDTKQAYKENAEFMAWGRQILQMATHPHATLDPEINQQLQQSLQQPPIQVMPLVDNNALHFLTHRRLCLTDEFKALPDMVKQVMFQHLMVHKQNLFSSQLFAPAPTGQRPGQSASAGSPLTTPQLGQGSTGAV